MQRTHTYADVALALIGGTLLVNASWGLVLVGLGVIVVALMPNVEAP